VCDAAGQGADGFHLLGMQELVLELLLLLLGLLALADLALELLVGAAQLGRTDLDSLFQLVVGVLQGFLGLPALVDEELGHHAVGEDEDHDQEARPELVRHHGVEDPVDEGHRHGDDQEPVLLDLVAKGQVPADVHPHAETAYAHAALPSLFSRGPFRRADRQATIRVRT